VAGFRPEALAFIQPVELAPNIRLVIATLDGGGSERVCVELANLWARQGRRVEILLVKRKGVYLSQVDSRVAVFSADATRTLAAIWPVWRRLDRWPNVPALLFGFDFGVAFGALKRCGAVRSPLIYREGSLPKQNIRKGSHWKYRAFISAMDGIIVQSELCRDEMQDLGVRAAKIEVVWNPVRARLPAATAPWGPTSGGPRLFSVGRLSPEKGYGRLIDAFAAVRREFPGATLTIAGDGPSRPEVESRIERSGLHDAVRLLGFRSDVDSLYGQFDLFVLPSFYEGQPNALLEALMQARPVAGAGGRTVHEVLTKLDLADCWIPDDNFPESLIRAMRHALGRQPSDWAAAREKLLVQAAPEIVGSRYLAVAEKLKA
jgi:GalNAc-alpha-(1->4)-GalNAc-alpha-(1->3)-diNAcBac-PP-undecaprenol alpha-1,4-N-acetyl-D-galactosaminyltransferase